MTEKELLEKIKSSAQEIEVPESLSPESMKKKLEDGLSEKQKRDHWHVTAGRKVIAAAMAVIVCGMGAVAAYQSHGSRAGADSAVVGMETAADAAGGMEASAESVEMAAEETVAEREPKVDAGEMYVVAKNYGEIYDLLKEQEEPQWKLWSNAGETTDGVMEEAVEEAAGLDTAVSADMNTSTGTMTDTVVQDLQASRGEASYSKTNVQTAGVDESDIIKTDGKYLYVVDEEAVKIIDIRDAKMREVGEVAVTLGSAADRVIEMYVDGDILNLIIEKEDTGLTEEKSKSSTYDVYYVDTDTETELLTYDISDRTNPVLKGSTRQDGFYKTSRKVGDIVYLFTEKYMELPNLTKRQATTEGNLSNWIPLVNDTAVAADCIYLPERGNRGLLISSVDVENPDSVVDNALIMNDYVNIYVSTKAIYLYESNYAGNGISTQIAKFAFKDGVINAVGATSASGEVYDTFAINEYQGKLRLLTTDWSSAERENQLYLFDEKLNLTGSLKGIAKGEQIYAARYFGDMVYFVTYRNTDPLFAVDLSDEKKPKILSELKITGFSEYLHFWGQDKLVGIGYETDPDTGAQKGIKLSMFDISDPANLTTLGTCVIENLDYSSALYNYKCVLVDEEENLIGFAAESYGREIKSSYLLFSWEEGGFHSLFSERIDGNEMLDEYRGIYVGDMFYLVNTEAVTSYDREKEYTKLQTLEW